MIMFWDLDGPILDVSKKYYTVYSDILLEHKEEPISKNKFWALKRSKAPIEDILTVTNSQKIIKKYKKSWIEKIETKNYQKFDTLQTDIINVLNKCAERRRLVIVTLRRNRKRLLTQLRDLGIIHYFKDVLSSGVDIQPRWQIKYNLITNYLHDKNKDKHIIIGDTELDILAGKNLYFYTIAISNGIRNDKILLKSNPDYIFQSISEYYNNYLLQETL